MEHSHGTKRQGLDAMQACKEVLQKVRSVAEARNAGIIFLGELCLPGIAYENMGSTCQDGLNVLLQAPNGMDILLPPNSISVAFAGDFWHARGLLPVVPLNTVLSEFQHWKQPTLMLVGNHDQVISPQMPYPDMLIRYPNVIRP